MLKTYHIKTFGCQMNYADSEKIDMILRSAGLRKVIDPTIADIIIMNTCSVRQKGEDRVFGFMNEISRFHKNNNIDKAPLFGITGCMVRKSGIARHFVQGKVKSEKGKVSEKNKNSEMGVRGEGTVGAEMKNSASMSGANSERVGLPTETFGTFGHKSMEEKYTLSGYKRKSAEKITLLESAENLSNYDDELFLRSPLIDFVFRIEEVSFLSKILSLITGENIGNDAKWNEYLAVKQLRENPANANIIIQTGCDNFCTFCIVPHTRGREISRPMGEIIDEIKETVSNGTKEITLLGQNVNSYGKETKGKLWNAEELTWKNKEVTTPFRELLENINTIDGLDRIRFTSSNPHDMTRDILDAHFELPKMCPYLHFALQSGSDTMLRRMNRKHTYEDFKTQVKYLRSRDPLFSISTDIIVGFPGETEEEFQETAQAMKECEFDFAYIARYSSRSGTIATTQYEDDISPEEKARRWTILNNILRESVESRAKLMIGREEIIIISGKGKDDTWVGRTRNFKEVFIPMEGNIQLGDMLRVKVESFDTWVLRGRKA